MKETWNSVAFSGNHMQTVMLKLKGVKKALVRWNKEVSCDVNGTVSQFSMQLQRIQENIANGGVTQKLLKEEADVHVKLSQAMNLQEQYWRQNSRLKWLRDGDRNTKFFHAYAKIKVAKAYIPYLAVGSEVVNDPTAIENNILHFYQDLYSSSQTTVEPSLMSHIPALISNADNAFLEAMPSDEKIRQAVFDLDPSSAAGPDGFNGHFYHQCWSLVGADVCAAIKEFFRIGVVQKYLNSNLVILLPKVKGANQVQQF